MHWRAKASEIGLALTVAVACFAQEVREASETPAQGVLTVRASLVLVPAMVQTRHGENVFALKASDFSLLDDGVPQSVRLEPDSDSQPLSLVVVVQTGAQGASHLLDYSGLNTVLASLVGAVSHRVAVVSFDSRAHLAQAFNDDTGAAAAVIAALGPGDSGAAILDGLKFATDLLHREPPGYRRALLLLSQTVDGGSVTSLDETIRAIEDTNTMMYSAGFSSTKTALKHEGAKLPDPLAQTRYSATPYSAGGCMSHEPDADPDAHGKRSVQALDCASDLLPPLRIARMAYIAAKDQLKRNVPESIARLTGGEYFTFKNAKSLNQGLLTLSNDVPNHYILSFQPIAPHAGLHALSVSLNTRPDFVIKARHAYWVDTP